MTEPDQRESIERLVANARDAQVPYPPQSDMGMIIWLLDALKATEVERDRLRVAVADYENGINWGTTCSNCARMLDGAYAQTMRAEKAEAERADAFDQGAAAMHKELRDPDGPGRPVNPYREPEANDDNNLRTWREETS